MIKGNLGHGTIKFEINLQFSIHLSDTSFDKAITLLQNFKRKDMIKDESSIAYSLTYRINYARVIPFIVIIILEKNI